MTIALRRLRCGQRRRQIISGAFRSPAGSGIFVFHPMLSNVTGMAEESATV